MSNDAVLGCNLVIVRYGPAYILFALHVGAVEEGSLKTVDDNLAQLSRVEVKCVHCQS